MLNKTAAPKSTQKTITIDQELWSELESWLSSKQAKKLGYHSKAQFCTEAVRNLLEKYTSGRNKEQEILDHIDNLSRELRDYASIDRKIELLEMMVSGSFKSKNPQLHQETLEETKELAGQGTKKFGKEEVQDIINELNNLEISKTPRPSKSIKKINS